MGLWVAMGIVPLNPSYLCAKTGYGLQADWPLMAGRDRWPLAGSRLVSVEVAFRVSSARLLRELVGI